MSQYLGKRKRDHSFAKHGRSDFGISCSPTKSIFPQRNSVFKQSFHVQQQFCEISQMQPSQLAFYHFQEKKKIIKQE